MFFFFFLKFFVSSLRTVFVVTTRPFLYVIIFCFTFCSVPYAQSYIPVDTQAVVQKKAFPNSIKILDNKKQILLKYKDYSATIFFDTKHNHYSAIMPDDSTVTVSLKNAAMIMTWISKKKDHYQTALYRRSDLVLPEKGRFYRNAPEKDDYFLSSPNFIDSYAFWTGEEVAHAYELLSYKEQGIIKLFPYVSAEILFKLCRAPLKNAGVIKLTKHHNISCNNISDAFYNLYNSINFKDFYIHLAQEKKLLSNIFACNHGLTPPPKCRIFQKSLSNQALSPQSIHHILQLKNNLQH